MTNWTNITTPGEMLSLANNNTGGWFWTIILYTIVIVLLLSMIQFSLEIAALVSFFVGIVLGIILIYMGLVNTLWVGILVGAELFIIIYLLISSSKNQ